MEENQAYETAIRYRGFLVLEQPNKSWLVRPERSPMLILPFRMPKCSLSEVKAIIDLRLSQRRTLTQEVKAA